MRARNSILTSALLISPLRAAAPTLAQETMDTRIDDAMARKPLVYDLARPFAC